MAYNMDYYRDLYRRGVISKSDFVASCLTYILAKPERYSPAQIEIAARVNRLLNANGHAMTNRKWHPRSTTRSLYHNPNGLEFSRRLLSYIKAAQPVPVSMSRIVTDVVPPDHLKGSPPRLIRARLRDLQRRGHIHIHPDNKVLITNLGLQFLAEIESLIDQS